MERGWAIVTGASSGIGLALSRALAREGYPVLAVARRRERLEALAAEVAAAGGRVEVLAQDLEADGAADAVVRRAAELGDVELLVNNAGLGDHAPFADHPLARALTTIRVNVTALVELTHRLLPALTARRGGVINIASTGAFQPVPWFAVYAATKSFVLHFSEALSVELRGRGVRVLALCPGPVATEFMPHDAPLMKRAPSVATPEEVARVTLRAYRGGRIVKIQGLMNAIGTFVLRLTPRALVRWMVGKLFRV